MIFRSMKTVVCALLVATACDAMAAKGSKEPDVRSGKPTYDEIADGTPLILRDGEITVAPPEGWEVFRTMKGVTLLTQAPLKPNTKYQRTIQVSRINGPRYIDDVTANEMSGWFVRRFGSKSKSIEGYTVTTHELTTTESGSPALLFYATFTFDDVKLMQAHLVVSNTDTHFVLTFTDTVGNFGTAEKPGKHLLEALKSMRTVKLNGETPERLSEIYVMGGAVAGIAVLVGALLWIRFHRSRSKIRTLSDGRNIEIDDSDKPTLDEEEKLLVEMVGVDTGPPPSNQKGEFGLPEDSMLRKPDVA